MKPKQRFWIFIGLFLGCWWPFFSHASSGIISAFDLAPTDQSLSYLGTLTGPVTGLMLTGTNNLFGPLFAKFNAAVLAVVLLVALITGGVSIFNSAQHGEIMGKKWSVVWVPTRLALGAALLAPSASGYSYIQIFILWLILQGMAGANALWDLILTELQHGQSLISTITLNPSLSDAQKQMLANIFQSAVCASYLNNIQPLYQGDTTPKTVQAALNGESVMLQQSPDGKTFMYTTDTLFIEYMNNPNATTTRCGPVPAIQCYAICGAYKLDSPFSAPSIPPSPIDLQHMAVINSYQASALSVFTNASRLADAVTIFGFNDAQKTISFNDNFNRFFDPAFAKALMSPLMSAYAKVTGSMNIPNPNLNSDIETARQNGWITAGSYYYDLISSSTGPQAKTPTLSSGTPLAVQPPNTTGAILANLPPATPGQIPLTPLGTTGYQSLYDNILAWGGMKTWGQLLGYYGNVNVIQPSSQMSSFGFNGGSNPMGALGKALQSLASSFAAYLTTNSRDPISSMANVGTNIMLIIESTWILGGIAILLTSVGANIMRCANSGGFVIDTVLRWIIVIVAIICALLWGAGALLGIYLPLIPYIVYLATCLGWLMGVLEAVVAAPLIALGLAAPSEDEFGKAAQSLMLIVNAFLRPALIVIGFASAIKLLQIGFKMLNFSFSATMHSQMPGLGFFGVIAVIGIYAGLALTIAHKCFSLIYAIPDRVIRWIGGGPDSMDEQSFLDKAKGSFEKGSAAGGKLGQALYGKIGKGGKPTTGAGGKLG